MSKIEIKLINPLDEAADLLPLLQANWAESGNPFDFIPEDVRATYTFFNNNDALFGVAAYQGDEMVGYCIVTLHPHPLNRSVKICNADGLFLKPELRGGTISGRMMAGIKDIASEHNATIIHWHAPAGSSFGDVLASRMELMSTYYREVLPC